MAVAATRLAYPDRPAPVLDRLTGAGTRSNTARLLCAALGEAAAAPSAGLAMPLTVLWSRLLSFDAADPRWPDRDRFVLSTPAASPLLTALLTLTGHTQTSQTPPPAAYGQHPAIEAPAAPGGQAIAIAVGMALTERLLAARFGKSLVDHRVWLAAAAAELAQGLAQEAIALAGQLRLDRLVLIADASQPGAEDARARIASLGWAVRSAPSDHPDEIESALSSALRSRKPTLLWCLPPAHSHPHTSSRSNHANAIEAWRRIGARGAPTRRAWLKRLARHAQRAEFERALAGRLPDGAHEALATLRAHRRAPSGQRAPADICRTALDLIATKIPELFCGHLDAPLSAQARHADAAAHIQPGQFAGRHLGFDHRPHGMAACANGIALHGGALPVITTRLIDIAEQLPALRLAALLGQRIVHIAIDDANPADAASACPAWRSAEALAWLRAIANLHLFQPACAIETAECLELAFRRAEGPSMLVVPPDPRLHPAADVPTPAENRCVRGGYVLAESSGPRQATLIGSGVSLPILHATRARLAAEGVAAAIVSLPCWPLFAAQPDAYRAEILGAAPRFAIEAGPRCGWDRWLNPEGGFLAPDHANGILAGATVAAQAILKRLE